MIYEPLTPEQRDALRDSIAREGVRDAVLVSSLSGRVLSGNNRVELATELGVPYETKVVVCATDLDELVVEIEENPQRRVDLAKRDATVEVLRAGGWSDGRIAALLGVSPDTVERTPGPAPAGPGVGRDGTRQPRRKATAAEIARREQIVAKLYREGYGRDAIAVALDVSNGTVDTDLRSTGVELRGKGQVVRTDRPEPVVWRTESVKPRARRDARRKLPKLPPPRPPRGVPMHRLATGSIARFANFRELVNERRLILGFTHEVDSAVELHDEEWIRETGELLDSLVDDFVRMRRVLDDPSYRNAQSRIPEGTPPTNVPARRLRSVP